MNASEARSEVSWPRALSLVLATQGPLQQEWAENAAVGVARKLTQHRKVVLVDLRTGLTPLAEGLRGGGQEGIVDVLFRGASFSRIAARPGSEEFFFLPLGESAPPPEVLLHHPRWRKIAGRLADADAHLLVCVSAKDWLAAGPIPGFENSLILNGPGREVELPSGARRFAELLAPPEIREAVEAAEPHAEAAGLGASEPAQAAVNEPVVVAGRREDAAPDTPVPSLEAERIPVIVGVTESPVYAPDESDSLKRWRERLSLPYFGSTGRRLASAAVVVAAVVTVAVLWAALGDRRAPEESTAFQVVAETTAVPEATQPAPANERDLGARLEVTTLPYSVAIASYSSFDDALAEQKRLARDELPVYVAPTPVRGVVYYRVFAGLLAERSGAEALMAELVREGIKDTVRAWDVREARYAFSFGSFSDIPEAREKVEALIEQGIHAYAVPVAAGPNGSEVAYRVYAGGYETREAAGPLREQIERAGLDAELIEKVGLVQQ